MTRSRAALGVAPVVVVIAAAVVIAAVLAVVLWPSSAGDPTGGRASSGPLRGERAAEAPFEGWTEASVRVGRRDLRVVVADEPAEQGQGLRGRRDAGPYDGMLFVFGGDTRTAFTMAGVDGPLDITFYAADGRVVDRLRMVPCDGQDATCPAYEADGAFRYALETVPGTTPTGRLRTGSG